MTISTHKLTGKLPIVGVDGVTRWTGTVQLDDEVTNVDAIVQSGGIEVPDPVVEAKASKPKE